MTSSSPSAESDVFRDLRPRPSAATALTPATSSQASRPATEVHLDKPAQSMACPCHRLLKSKEVLQNDSRIFGESKHSLPSPRVPDDSGYEMVDIDRQLPYQSIRACDRCRADERDRKSQDMPKNQSTRVCSQELHIKSRSLCKLATSRGLHDSLGELVKLVPRMLPVFSSRGACTGKTPMSYSTRSMLNRPSEHPAGSNHTKGAYHRIVNLLLRRCSRRFGYAGILPAFVLVKDLSSIRSSHRGRQGWFSLWSSASSSSYACEVAMCSRASRGVL